MDEASGPAVVKRKLRTQTTLRGLQPLGNLIRSPEEQLLIS